MPNIIRFFLYCLTLVSIFWLPASYAQKIPLDQAQHEYLQKKKVIRFCTAPNWTPFEWLDANGQHHGMVSDYLQLIQGMLDIKFELVHTEIWAQSIAYIKAGRCDMLTSVAPTKSRDEYLTYTQPYFQALAILVTPKDTPQEYNLEYFSGKVLAIPADYYFIEQLQENEPDISILPTRDMADALGAVAAGQADGALSSLLVASHLIQKLGLSNLKLSGPVDYVNNFTMAVHKDQAVLAGILDKALSQIDEQQRQQIRNNWYNVEITHNMDYRLLWFVLSSFVVIGIFFSAHYLSVRRLNHKLRGAHEQLQQQHLQLQKMAESDPLTGIYNRIRLDKELQKESHRSKRYKSYFTVVLLDLDNFKQVNDKHGHLIGDQVLQIFAKCIQQNLRRTDVFGRWGGEEFLLLCPQTRQQEAVTLAEKLQEVIRTQEFADNLTITCSMGVAEHIFDEELEHTIDRADQALYQAKTNGRNRVVQSPSL